MFHCSLRFPSFGGGSLSFSTPSSTGIALKRGGSSCNPAHPLQESPETVPKPSRLGVQTVSETVSKQSLESQTVYSETLEIISERVSDSLWTPGPEGPGTLWRLGFLARAQETPVSGVWGCKALLQTDFKVRCCTFCCVHQFSCSLCTLHVCLDTMLVASQGCSVERRPLCLLGSGDLDQYLSTCFKELLVLISLVAKRRGTTTTTTAATTTKTTIKSNAKQATITTATASTTPALGNVITTTTMTITKQLQPQQQNICNNNSNNIDNIDDDNNNNNIKNNKPKLQPGRGRPGGR